MKSSTALVTILTLPAVLGVLATPAHAGGVCSEERLQWESGTTQTTTSCVVAVNEGGWAACVGYTKTVRDEVEGSGRNDSGSEKCTIGYKPQAA